MANKGAKKTVEENAKRLKLLRWIIIASIVTHIVIRIGIRWSSLNWLHLLGFSFSIIVSRLCYGQLKQMTEPSYDATGELVDGGYDLHHGGLSSYLQDIVYVTAFVLFASSVSSYFWLIFLVIPIFAFYKLWDSILYPYIFDSAQEPQFEDEKTRKKREKLERKTNRAAAFRGRGSR